MAMMIHVPQDIATTGVVNSGRESKRPEFNTKNSGFSLLFELRHIFRLMSVFGLYHTPTTCYTARLSTGWRAFSHYAQQFYCLTVQLVLWFNVFRVIVGLWAGDERSLNSNLISFKIMSGAWYLQNAANSSICYFICSTQQLPTSLHVWQTSCQSSDISKVLGTSLDVEWVRRRIRFALVCCISFIVFSSISFAYSCFGPIPSLRNDTIALFVPLTNAGYAWKIPIICSLTFTSAAYVLPLGFYLILCSLLSQQFTRLTTTFTSGINENGEVHGCLMRLRRQHQFLSKTVFLLDDIFSLYLAVSIAAPLCTTCFGLYQLVIAQHFKSGIAIVIMVFWLLVMSANFGLVGWFSATISEKAHDIGNYIHDIGVFGFNKHEEVMQMNMFLAKLNGPPIAFTLWTFLPITKEFVLTVVGVFFTYFVLLAQSI